MTEEDLLTRAVEERRYIVERYKCGCQNEAKPNLSENASLVEVYGDLDRYGFKRYDKK